MNCYILYFIQRTKYMNCYYSHKKDTISHWILYHMPQPYATPLDWQYFYPPLWSNATTQENIGFQTPHLCVEQKCKMPHSGTDSILGFHWFTDLCVHIEIVKSQTHLKRQGENLINLNWAVS
jgi:hypothetical protein